MQLRDRDTSAVVAPGFDTATGGADGVISYTLPTTLAPGVYASIGQFVIAGKTQRLDGPTFEVKAVPTS